MTEKEKKYQQELEANKGKYVAVKDMEVVASGNSAKEVLQKAEKKHVDKPVIFGVPAVKSGCSFF